jgi:hypothetical protein
LRLHTTFEFESSHKLSHWHIRFHTKAIFCHQFIYLVSSQEQVHQVLEERKQKRLREQYISLDFARKFPIAQPNSVKSVETDARSEVSTPRADGTRENSPCQSDERMKIPPQLSPSPVLEAKVSLKKPLPAPLSHALLRAAARELPQGSLKAIEVCLRCWLENRLDDSELTATVRSFASASRALRDVFLLSSPQSPRPAEPTSGRSLQRASSSTGCGEQQVATKEQMRDLALSAAYCM